MENLLFWSKCSIFQNIFKSIQNITWIFLDFSMLSKNRKWCHDLKIAYGVKSSAKIIFIHHQFTFNEQLKFHAQLRCAWKKFYILRASSWSYFCQPRTVRKPMRPLSLPVLLCNPVKISLIFMIIGYSQIQTLSPVLQPYNVSTALDQQRRSWSAWPYLS